MENKVMWGSEYLIAHSLAPCCICKRPTYFIDIFVENRVCSEKCAKVIDKMLWRQEQAFIEEQARRAWETGCTDEEWFDLLIELDMKERNVDFSCKV